MLIFLSLLGNLFLFIFLTNDLLLKCFKKCPQSPLVEFRIENRSAVCRFVGRVLNSDWKALESKIIEVEICKSKGII